jgi:hypothetical protein
MTATLSTKVFKATYTQKQLVEASSAYYVEPYLVESQHAVQHFFACKFLHICFCLVCSREGCENCVLVELTSGRTLGLEGIENLFVPPIHAGASEALHVLGIIMIVCNGVAFAIIQKITKLFFCFCEPFFELWIDMVIEKRSQHIIRCKLPKSKIQELDAGLGGLA